MRYFEAPEYWDKEAEPGTGIFLFGGITECEDWQRDLATRLADVLSDEYVLLNPRQSHFDVDDPKAAEEQIMWEYRNIAKADVRIFWFTPPTLNPITLFEYGKAIMYAKKPLFVGCHPDYARKLDVEIQTRLEKPNQLVVDDLGTLFEEVMAWTNGKEFGKKFQVDEG